MDDNADIFGSLQHIGGIHRVALHPFECRLVPRCLSRLTVECPDAPATLQQLARYCAADTTGRAEHQGRLNFSTHDYLLDRMRGVCTSKEIDKIDEISASVIRKYMSIEPSWDFYRSFLTVLQQGSLSAAARELGLTQPTIGRHVDALEKAIGAELFIRSPNGLLPTDAAQALKPYAETLAATTAALLRTASGERERVAGTVRVSASEVIAVEVLPKILGSLQDAYPELQIELSASDVIEDLVNREADIAVRMAEPQQGALIVRRIGDIPIGFHAHRCYLERHGNPQTIADLANHRLIGFDRQTAYVRMVMKRYPVPADIKFSYRTDSNLAQLCAIRAASASASARSDWLGKILTSCTSCPMLSPYRSAHGW